MRPIPIKRHLTLTLQRSGQGKKMAQIIENKHRGHFQELSPNNLAFTPDDSDHLQRHAQAHIFPHMKKRLTYQGHGAQNWQTRSTHGADQLPKFVDWTQGEMVQENIWWDAPQPKSVRMNPMAAHTMVVESRVPSYVTPPLHRLRNSPFKPFVTKNANDHASIGEQIAGAFDPKWDPIQYYMPTAIENARGLGYTHTEYRVKRRPQRDVGFKTKPNSNGTCRQKICSIFHDKSAIKRVIERKMTPWTWLRKNVFFLREKQAEQVEMKEFRPDALLDDELDQQEMKRAEEERKALARRVEVQRLMIDTAIIGAGIAGITCASRLHRSLKIEVYESSDSIGGRTQSVKLGENIIVNLGANWLAGQRNPLVKFISIRNWAEDKEDEELCVTVLNEHFIDITKEYMPHADEYMMALDQLEKSNEPNSISIKEALMKNTNYQYPSDLYLSGAIQYLVGNEGYSGYDDSNSSHGDTITTELLYKGMSFVKFRCDVGFKTYHLVSSELTLVLYCRQNRVD